MQVSKWGNSLAIRLPAAVVEVLDLHEGDDIEVHVAGSRHFAVVAPPGPRRIAAPIEGNFADSFRPTSSSTGTRRMPGSFFDTNVLLYLVAEDSIKADRAEMLVRGGGTISVQVLNEVANVARRKTRMSWDATRGLLDLLRGLLTVAPLTVEVHERGLAIAERHRFSIYDSLIVAAALMADCDVLWSEDLQNGMLVERRLRVTNPFVT